MKKAFLLLLTFSLAIALPATPLLAAADTPTPEGSFGLALILPKTVKEGHTIPMDGTANVYVQLPLEVTLKSENVKEDGQVSKGKFTISILDKSGKGVTYAMTHLLTDGSGSHSDYVYAASKDDLPDNPESYARGGGAPFEKVIFYILSDPELKGGPALKQGDRAGTLTLNGQRYALIKK